MIYFSYIKLSTLEYPRHEGDIRLEHPEISEDQTGDTFPCPDTYAPIEQPLFQPSFDESTHHCVMLPPVQQDGKWVVRWDVVELTDRQKEAYQRYQQAMLQQIAEQEARMDAEAEAAANSSPT